MSDVDAQLDRIKKLDQGKPRKNVTVLGAGMAGLVAAYELQRLKHTVEVVEANDRVGGRVFTHHFNDAAKSYGELGAMRIPGRHDYTRYYVKEMGLKLRPFISAYGNENVVKKCFYDIRDIQVRIAEAPAKLFPAFRLSPAELRLATAAVAPAILGNHFSDEILRLTGADEASLFAFSPITDKARQLDEESLLQFLDRRLQSLDAKELIGTTTGLEMLWDRSVAMFLRDEILGTGQGLEEIEGGMDSLPKKLAEKLAANTIRLKTEVLALRPGGPKASVVLKPDGEGPVETTCDYVICTIPFGVLRRLDVQGFSPGKREAIRNLSYASSTKVLIHCKERFWENDPKYGIFGGASLSDQIIRSVYYPSDNASAATPSTSPPQSKGLTTAYSFQGDIGGNKKDVSNGPGVLLGSYNWGLDARRLGAMTPNERAQIVIDKISRFHPELPKYADDHASMVWDQSKWAAGAFSFLQPGDQTAYLQNAVQTEGAVHFAGEHCSTDQAWIQGAIMSGLRAVEEIVTR